MHAAGAEIRQPTTEAAAAEARLVQFPVGSIVYPDKRAMSVNRRDALDECDWSHTAWDVIGEEAQAIAECAGRLGVFTAFRGGALRHRRSSIDASGCRVRAVGSERCRSPAASFSGEVAAPPPAVTRSLGLWRVPRGEGVFGAKGGDPVGEFVPRAGFGGRGPDV